jgi:hypothetical protein
LLQFKKLSFSVDTFSIIVFIIIVLAGMACDMGVLLFARPYQQMVSQ